MLDRTNSYNFKYQLWRTRVSPNHFLLLFPNIKCYLTFHSFCSHQAFLILHLCFLLFYCLFLTVPFYDKNNGTNDCSVFSWHSQLTGLLTTVLFPRKQESDAELSQLQLKMCTLTPGQSAGETKAIAKNSSFFTFCVILHF